MHLSELKALPVTQLVELAMSLEIDNASRLRKQELMFAILKKKAKLGEQIFGDGVLGQRAGQAESGGGLVGGRFRPSGAGCSRGQAQHRQS